MRKPILKYLLMATLMAIFVVLDYYSIKVGMFKFTLSAIAIIIAALFFGPVDACIVGLLGALIGQLLGFGFTATTVLWILPAGIRGILLGFAFKNNKVISNSIYLFFSILVSSIIVTLFNTFAIYVDSKLFGYYSYAVVFGSFLKRFLTSILTSGIYFVILLILTSTLQDKISNIRNMYIKGEKK